MKTFVTMISGAFIFVSGICLGAYLVSPQIQRNVKRAFTNTEEETATDNHASSVLHDCEIKGFCSDYAG